MTEEAKEARRAYKREWAKKNRDKIKAAEERYWTRKAAENYVERKAAERQAKEQEPAPAPPAQ